MNITDIITPTVIKDVAMMTYNLILDEPIAGLLTLFGLLLIGRRIFWDYIKALFGIS